MQTLLTKREQLQTLITSEWGNYNKAIRGNKPFEEIKTIYLRIKQLKQELRDISLRSEAG